MHCWVRLFYYFRIYFSCFFGHCSVFVCFPFVFIAFVHMVIYIYLCYAI